MKIAIFGAGGHGKIAADVAISMGYKEILFFDDKNRSNNIKKFGTYCGDINKINEIDNKIPFFIAIGDNGLREKFYGLIKKNSKKIVTLIHKNSIVSKYSNIGKCVIIMPGAVVNSSTKLSLGCILNTSSSLDHDCSVNKFTHICPGTTIAGNVKIGKSSFIGAGTTIINNIVIGSNVFIGGGSFVYKNILSGTKYKNIYK
jgi:sugar O-acyltransferase (sialic acid O-acetyltransferase NeuD family)